MDSFQSVLGDAAGGALCSVLSAYGSSAPLLTAISLIEPTPIGEGLAVAAGLAGLAATVGCQWDPNQPGPPGNKSYEGCRKAEGGYITGKLGTGNSENPNQQDFSVFTDAIEVYKFEYTYQTPNGVWVVGWEILQRGFDGNPPAVKSGEVGEGDGNSNLYTYISEGQPGNCVEYSPGTPPPEPPTYTHTDPASGCQLNVDFKGWALDQAGNVNGVWQIAPASVTRSSGGVIGGCNFAPTIYIDGGGGGGGPINFPVPDPVPPDGDEPWWAPLARGAAQGLAAAAVQKALDELFRQDFVGGSYELKGVCELDPDGNPMDVTRSTNYPAAPGLDAVLYRLDALAEMFQFDKELRQPTCRQHGPSQTGQPVTINWRSDVYTDTGNNVARKRLSYFDQSGSTLADHVTHWKDFTWTAGLVIVNCLDTQLGKPQIWASSLDEAKRVFAHAAAIAGVDLTNARYEVGTSKDPRYGFSGLMRVDVLRDGTKAITMRDGPSGLPEALA
jgi:hypothetical protein